MRITLFDQETAERNYIASVTREVDREARADERQKTTLNVNLAAIKNLMENMKLSAQEAMSVLSIPLDQQSIYAAQL